MVYGCAAIFVVVEYEAGVDRELVDVDRLCLEKKWGLTSNDETIEAILLFDRKGRREVGVRDLQCCREAVKVRVFRFIKEKSSCDSFLCIEMQ